MISMIARAGTLHSSAASRWEGINAAEYESALSSFKLSLAWYS